MYYAEHRGIHQFHQLGELDVSKTEEAQARGGGE